MGMGDNQWGSLEERLARYVVRGSDCWTWLGPRNAVTGYGSISVNKRRIYAHRFMYERLVGAIPPGLELDHLCRVRACVNPSHLEAVTHAENSKRARPGLHNSLKTHCPAGHPYSTANTLVYAGRRNCRACTNAASRDRKRLARAHVTQTQR